MTSLSTLASSVLVVARHSGLRLPALAPDGGRLHRAPVASVQIGKSGGGSSDDSPSATDEAATNLAAPTAEDGLPDLSHRGIIFDDQQFRSHGQFLGIMPRGRYHPLQA